MRTTTAFVAAALVLGVPACIDESHDLEVDALGGETSNVNPGPTHRPGQPCLVCHGGLGPGSPQFVVAGTVYAVEGATTPARGARVTIEDTNGSFYNATTNEVGNFYIAPDQWSPVFPLQATVSQGGASQQMLTHIGRDGSCAGCHVNPASATSPGAVYVTPSFPEGGT
ncbi:MAG TPA: hypothetical protein VHV30_16860 [Polyangiaceae bacterium]|jgi:hypothetical protein|nr:hypothetical protein [Polyangiaceae bacterium]